MKKFFRVFYSQIFNSFFPIIIIGILVKLSTNTDITFIFLLLNFSNIYLLFSDYSSNTILLKDALKVGGISHTAISQSIVADIHSYLGIKIIILSIGVAIWIPICLYTPLFQKNILSNILAYTFIAGNNINFYWLYMCSSKEYFFIISNILGRLFFLLLLITFIIFRLNFSYLMPIAGFGIIVISILTFFRFCNIYKIKVKFSFTIIKNAVIVVKRDWPMVVNSFLIMTPTTCLSFFIGFIKNSKYVIIYAFAEKIFMAIRGLLAIFVNSIFPVICEEGSVNTRKSNKIFIFFYLAILTGCGFVYWISPFIFFYFKQPASLNYMFNKCLFYFMLTVIIISLNTRFLLNLLVLNYFNRPKNFIYFLFSAVCVVTVFISNAFFINTVFSIVKALLAGECIIVLAFVIVNNFTRTKPSRQSIIPTVENVF